MPSIELIYDGDCPNVADARAQLVRAAVRAGVEPRWREWRSDGPDSPPHVRGYGSPTILVEGRDVAAAGDSDGDCCRLYAQPDGSVAGVPSEEALAAVLERHAGRRAAPEEMP